MGDPKQIAAVLKLDRQALGHDDDKDPRKIGALNARLVGEVAAGADNNHQARLAREDDADAGDFDDFLTDEYGVTTDQLATVLEGLDQPIADALVDMLEGDYERSFDSPSAESGEGVEGAEHGDGEGWE